VRGVTHNGPAFLFIYKKGLPLYPEDGATVKVSVIDKWGGQYIDENSGNHDKEILFFDRSWRELLIFKDIRCTWSKHAKAAKALITNEYELVIDEKRLKIIHPMDRVGYKKIK
jgi:hypothetical protein